jgi:hypothetical protein
MRNIIAVCIIIFNFSAAADRDSFIIYVDSMSVNKGHNRVYGAVADLNSPENRKSNEEIKKYGELYPYYPAIVNVIEEKLNTSGYQKFKVKNLKRDSLFPIHISTIYLSGIDHEHGPTLLLSIGAKEYIMPGQEPEKQLSFLDYTRWRNQNSKANAMTMHLWNVVLRVKKERELLIYDESTLLAMARCAALYFDKNFQGVSSCRR